ncbi:MAG: hypothetical protein V4576_03200 [Patescibacteria group bacterium]
MTTQLFSAFFFLLSLCGAAKATTLLTLDSQTRDLSTGHVLVADWFGREIPKNTLDIYLQTDQQSLTELILAAPYGFELKAGLYTGAVQYIAPADLINDQITLPSLALWIDGKPIQVAKGSSFQVLEIEWASNGRPLRAAIDFQIIQGADAPLNGSLRFNSTVPEPSVSLFFVGTVLLSLRRKR